MKHKKALRFLRGVAAVLVAASVLGCLVDCLVAAGLVAPGLWWNTEVFGSWYSLLLIVSASAVQRAHEARMTALERGKSTTRFIQPASEAEEKRLREARVPLADAEVRYRDARVHQRRTRRRCAISAGVAILALGSLWLAGTPPVIPRVAQSGLLGLPASLLLVWLTAGYVAVGFLFVGLMRLWMCAEVLGAIHKGYPMLFDT